MRVGVVGGTGVVGRLVVQRLRDRGDEPVVLARSTGADVTTGAGLDDALRGAVAVIDVSGPASASRSACVRFAEQATGHLLAAGERAGVQHHVALSIVGVDRVDTGYYAGKRRQEELVLSGPLPSTVLRATQFHEFAGQVLARTRRGPLAVVPRMRTQPVAADEVAEALVGLLAERPHSRAPDLGGPEVHELPDLVRRLLRARGERVRVLALPVPGAAGRAMARGGLLTGPGARTGRKTFEQWLAAGGASTG